MAKARGNSAGVDGSDPTSSAGLRMLILHGQDRFLGDEHLARLREALAKAHGADGFDTVRFDGAAGSRIIADVLDECRSRGLMQAHKLVLVENADQLVKVADEDAAPAKPIGGAKAAGRGKRGHVPASVRELLEGYAKEPSDSATLVLRAGTWRPGNLDKAVLAMGGGAGAIVKCEAMSGGELIAWAQKRAKAQHATSIGAQAAGLLVEAVGADMGRIDTELAKLALAAGGNGEAITPELVSTMVGVSREDEFWSIQTSLISGDTRATLAHLRDLIEVSRHDPVPITHSYTEMARRVHLAARAIGKGVALSSIAPALKIFGPPEARNQQLGQLQSAATSAGASGAARLLAASVATDAAGKSGLGDPVRNLETLTVKFNAVTNRRRR